MAQVLLNEDAACVVDGVEYHAVSTPHPTCVGCAFQTTAVSCWDVELRPSPCGERFRNDRTDVIWVAA